VAPRLILLGALLAQLADAATFVVGEELYGIDLESNPLALMAFHVGGLAGVMAVKGAVLLIVILVAAAVGGRHPRVLLWTGAAATAIGLLGCAANITSMVLLAR
jgi:hypothetical protein